MYTYNLCIMTRAGIIISMIWATLRGLCYLILNSPGNSAKINIGYVIYIITLTNTLHQMAPSIGISPTPIPSCIISSFLISKKHSTIEFDCITLVNIRLRLPQIVLKISNNLEISLPGFVFHNICIYSRTMRRVK